MSRVYDVALRINGELGNLQNAVNSAQRSLRNLGNSARTSSANASRATQNLQSRLNALQQNLNSTRQFQNLNAGIRNFSRETAQANLQARQLQSQLQMQERLTERMRQNFARLQDARNSNRSSVSSSTVTNARRELRSQEQSLNQLRTQYQSAQRTADSLTQNLNAQVSTLNNLRSAFQSAGVGANNLASHERNLQSQIQQTNSRLSAQQNFDSARDRMNARSQNVSYAAGNFQDSLSTAGSILSPFKSAIDSAKDFEFEMSQVKSLTQMRDIRAGNLDKVNASMQALTAEAKRLGQTTEYTSIQAAQMQSKLAMSGWSDANILNAGQSIMDLATATKVDLPVAADIASDLIQAFGLKVGDTVKIAGKEYDAAKHFVDTFAYATTSANTDVQGFKDTFKYAAPITKQWGLSLHEAAAAAMVTANSSIKGTQAGTAFKTGLLRLAGPPKQAGKALDEMGLSMSDATKMMQEAQSAMQDLGIDTNFKEGTTEGQKFSSLMSQMNAKFKDMSADEKLANINKIFGSNAAPFWAEMFANFDQYQEVLKEMDSGIDGWAQNTAAVMRENTKTQEDLLNSAADAAQQSIGDVFLPAYSQALSMATNAATALGNWDQTAVQWAGILAAGLAGILVAAAGVQLAFAGWGFISGALGMASAAVTAFSARLAACAAVQRVVTVATSAWAAVQGVLNGLLFANPIGLVVAGIAALVGVIYLAYTHIDELKNRWETLKSALSHPIEAVINFMDHGDVVGGNVKSGEQIAAAQSSGGGNFSAPAQNLDTSQAQAQSSRNFNAKFRNKC